MEKIFCIELSTLRALHMLYELNYNKIRSNDLADRCFSFHWLMMIVYPEFIEGQSIIRS